MAERLGKTDHKAQRKGITKNQIIELIIRGQGKTTWSDLLKKLRISKPTLFEHLDDLKKEGKIVSKKEGKRSFYKLTEQAWDDLETKIQLFSMSSLSIINKTIAGDSDDKLQKTSEYGLLRKLSRQISALALFSILKSIEKNENWYDAIVFYLWQPGGAHALIQRKIVYPEGKMSMMGKPLENISVLKPKIKKMYDALKKLYPKEIEQLEETYQNPREPTLLETKEKLWKWSLPGRSVPLRSVKLPTKQGLSKDTVVVIRKLKEPEPKTG